MSGYINANSNVNIDACLNLFKRLYYYVKDKFSKKEDNEELSFEELVEIYSKDEEFLNYVDYINSSLDNIAESMEEINFAHYEYDNFMSIKKMITYIINDIPRYLKYSSFILPLLTAYNNLLESQNSPNYEDIYEEFDIFLYEQEDIFYTEIFESTHKYDDLIDKVTNILG